MADLSALLEQTTSGDVAAVQTATAALEQEANAPGFGLKLLAICASAVGAGHLQNQGVAAGTYLKNFIKSKWVPPTGESIISAGERCAIRTQLVDILLRVDGTMLRVLAEAFRLVSKHDFAEKKWPDLVAGLHSAVQRSNLVNGMQDSPIKTLNALIAVDAVVKPFQYFRNPSVEKETPPEELENLTKELLVPMHSIFHLVTTQILAGQTGTEQDSILLIICKVFHHTIKSYMPTSLEPTVGLWISDVLSLLRAVVVNVSLDEACHEARLKAWKRMLQICSVLITRHRKHADKYLQQIFEAPMSIIMEASKVTGLPYLQERVVALSFSLIGSILETGAGWRIVAAHFGPLIETGILPALCLHKEDIEEWETDEEEYLTKNLPSDLDDPSGFKEDLYTPRRNALNLLGLIATAKGPPTASGMKKAAATVTAKRKKSNKGKVLPSGADASPTAGEVLVLPHLQKFGLPRDGSIAESEDIKQYYGVLLAYGGLQEYFSKKPEQVAPLLQSRVFPLYAMISPSPYVMANANWLLGELSDCIPEDLVTTVFRALLKSIGSKDIGELSWRPVRSAAAGAIAKLVAIETETVQIPWLELLQAAVAGVASDSEDEAATMLQLLGVITETNDKGLAAHIPAVFGSVAESISRHMPPPPEDWPWVVECGFRTLVSLMGTWNAWVDEEEDGKAVIPDADPGRISIAASIATLLQNAWLAPQEDAEQMEPADAVEATPSSLGEASFLMIDLCYRTEDMSAVEKWRVEDLLQTWAHRILDWPAWQTDEEENVFSAIEAAIDLHKRCALPHFTVLKELPHSGSQMQPLSVLEGMAQFLRYAIEAADTSTVWKACVLTHALIHSCALSFDNDPVKAAILSLAKAMQTRLASATQAEEEVMKPLALALATCFLTAPALAFSRPPREEPPLPEGILLWGNSLVKVVGHNDDSYLALETEAKLALLALVRLVEYLDKTSAGAPQGVTLARSSLLAAMEALKQLKKIQASQDEMEEEDGAEGEDEEAESSGDDESVDEEEAAGREETHEEFLARYARAAKQAEEEIDEDEDDEEEELEEIELGTFALTDEVATVLTSLKLYAQRLLINHPMPEETIVQFIEEFPEAKQMLS